MADFKEPRRFWSKVDVGEPDECWEWLASGNEKGYGKFRIKGRLWYAHRVAWILTYGPIPKGLLVCHRCDNRGCCNPYHLFLGTSKDNVADAVEKGRYAKKLTQENVSEIRSLYATGEWTLWNIADEFGVTRPAISYVLRRYKEPHDHS